MILAVDPGKMSGYAFLNMEGVLKDMGQFQLSALPKFLDSLTPEIKHFVIENFKVRPGVNFAWQEMDTIQVIGACKYRAHQIGAEVHLQEPSSYGIGAKWAGVVIPRSHEISHQVVAYAHGTYFSHNRLKNPIPVARNQHGKEKQGREGSGTVSSPS